LLEYKEIITYIFAIGIAQAFVLFFILLKKKENRFANKFLAITMLIFAIDLLAGVSFLTGYVKNIPWVVGLNNSFPYLYGPLIYLYVVFLIHDRESLKLPDYLHFVPFVIIHMYGVFFFYFEGSEYQILLLDFSRQQPWHIELIGGMIPVSGLAYICATILTTHRFNKKIRNSLANIENVDISWLMYLVIGNVVIWLTVFLSYFLGFLYGEEIYANFLIYIAISIFLYTFAIKSYRQPEVLIPSNFNDATYKKSGLSEEQAILHLNKLKELFKNEKPFLDPKLNLGELATMMNVSSHNLSEIINTQLNKNFYDFINSYRVEEVKKNILNDKSLTYSILAHGFDAGFTSKSAFYSAFKKFEGTTPSNFRKLNAK
jgi:AraC-like DNA-binding protein